MTAIRRSVMTLFYDGGRGAIHGHRIRIVLAEKGVPVDVIAVDKDNPPQDFIDLNPHHILPTLVDRDLVLYRPDIIIMEYLDERFPYPPLLPVQPVARAKCRLMIYRIEQDWYSLVDAILQANPKTIDKSRKDLRDSLVSLAPVFAEMPYFLSEEFSLVDCTLAPLLWRLPQLGIEIPRTAKAIKQYADRVFERDSFKASLSENER